MATVLLFMSRKEFWETTPRLLFSLLDAHAQVNSIDKNKKKSGSKSNKISNDITPVDQIPFL